ncbi:MAG: chorismate-binding protein, partial [Acidobacteriota bacterium]
MGKAGTAPAPTDPSAQEFLTRAVATLPDDRLRLVSLPAPEAPLERLWQAWPDAEAVLWDPPGGHALAGVGSALAVEASGPQRFAILEAAVAAATAAAESVAMPGCSPVSARFVGGLAFAPGGASEEPWRPLGEGYLVIPRWEYQRTAAGGQLTLALAPGQRPRWEELAGEYDHLRRVLAGEARPGSLEAEVQIREEPPARAWAAAVERARGAIRAGALAKVVLARRLVVAAGAPLAPEALLANLAAHEQGLYRFGIRRHGRALVGASPELLVARAALEVRSEALAGSAPRGCGEGLPAAELLGDPKQEEEHRLVVEAVREALAGVCGELVAPPRPTVRLLRHLAHLHTPLTGTLARPVSVLALAARLHPTPAVGGVPREAALELIGASEDAPRGWFAGPFG